MAGSLISTLYDEVQRVWRYRWFAIAIAALIFGAAGAYIMHTPDIYEASAQIFVNKETPVSTAAHGVSLVGDNFGSAYVVQKTLLNDQYLKNMIVAINPAANSMDQAALAGAITSLRQKIRIDPDQGDGFFQIHYQDTDPVRARDVVQLLLNQFITANIYRNHEDLNRAERFLAEQIALYAVKSRDSDEELASFRRKHPGVVHAEGAAAAGDPTSEVAAARSAYEAALANPGSTNVSASVEDSAITALREKIAAMRMQYTDQYPDVVAANRQLNFLIAAQSSTPPPAAAAPKENTTLRYARDRLAAAQARLHQSEQGPAASPLDAQWNDLKKNNTLLHGNYEELLSRREATRMSQAVYADKNSGKYQVTAPPQVPPIPSGPNRGLLLLLAAISATGVGLAAAYLRGAINGIFIAPHELENAFGLPVAGTVSLEKAWRTDRPAKATRRLSAKTVAELTLIGTLGFLFATGISGFTYPASGSTALFQHDRWGAPVEITMRNFAP